MFPFWYVSKIGLGSVGFEILCLRVEEVLALGSDAPELNRGLDALRPNHFAGLLNSCPMPIPEDEGEGERGNACGCGVSVLLGMVDELPARLGAIKLV